MPGDFGFNLADVSSAGQLDALPPGVKGLAWVGKCNGADDAFVAAMRPYIGHAKLFGFYLMDDPDPRPRLAAGRLSAPCPASSLMAEADWIHAKIPGAKTFVALMNLSTSKTPSFMNSYNPANSHVDGFGLGAYPCRTELHGCDFDMIDRSVRAAEAAGVPRSQIVPIYQSFGGSWADGDGGTYILPTASDERQILAHWGALVAAPAFDYAYSWGSQNGDVALAGAPELRALFSAHNRVAAGPGSEAELVRRNRVH